MEAAQVAIDYYLDAGKGTTILRLVHSGFLTSPGWDDEYDGTRRGWPIMLAILRYGLEYHPHVRGRQSWLYRTTAMAAAHAWARFAKNMNPNSALVSQPAQLYSAAWEELGSGLIYAAFKQRGDTTGVSLHVVLYGDAGARIAEASALWNKRLVEMFPEARGATVKIKGELSCQASDPWAS